MPIGASFSRPRRTHPPTHFPFSTHNHTLMTTEPLQYLEPLGAAVVFSLLWYARSTDTGTLNTDDWQWSKFAATFVVGLAVSFGMWLAGADMSMVEFEVRMATYAGTVVLIQGAIQAIVRNVRDTGTTQQRRR